MQRHALHWIGISGLETPCAALYFAQNEQMLHMISRTRTTKVMRLVSVRLRGSLLFWITDFLSTTSLRNISHGSPIVRQRILSRPFPLDWYR